MINKKWLATLSGVSAIAQATVGSDSNSNCHKICSETPGCPAIGSYCKVENEPPVCYGLYRSLIGPKVPFCFQPADQGGCDDNILKPVQCDHELKPAVQSVAFLAAKVVSKVAEKPVKDDPDDDDDNDVIWDDPTEEPVPTSEVPAVNPNPPSQAPVDPAEYPGDDDDNDIIWDEEPSQITSPNLPSKNPDIQSDEVLDSGFD